MFCGNPAYIHIGDPHLPRRRLPETHQQLQQCRLAGTALAGNGNDLALREVCGQIVEDLLLIVGKGQMLHLRPGKSGVLPFQDFPRLRLLLQQSQDPLTGGQDRIQGTGDSSTAEKGSCMASPAASMTRTRPVTAAPDQADAAAS